MAEKPFPQKIAVKQRFHLHEVHLRTLRQTVILPQLDHSRQLFFPTLLHHLQL
jgi:hypothetical protein